jgi:hypothetical protein
MITAPTGIPVPAGTALIEFWIVVFAAFPFATS